MTHYFNNCRCHLPELSIDCIKCSRCKFYYRGLDQWLNQRGWDINNFAKIREMCLADLFYSKKHDTVLMKLIKKYPDDMTMITPDQLKRLAGFSLLVEESKMDNRGDLSGLRETVEPVLLYKSTYTQPGRIQTPDIYLTILGQGLSCVIMSNETGYKLVETLVPKARRDFENILGQEPKEMFWELECGIFLDRLIDLLKRLEI